MNLVKLASIKYAEEMLAGKLGFLRVASKDVVMERN